MIAVRWRNPLACAVLFGMAVGVAAPLPGQDSLPTHIDGYMRALVALDRFSGTVLVARDGRVIHQAGYGLANAEWGTANAPDTRFRVGSITKQFTAMAILVLANRRALALSDSICRFIKPCPVQWRPITIRDLLTHSSGIPDYTELPGFARRQMVPATPHELIARVRNLPLRFHPGARFEYDNSGYVILGAIIERASGASYEAFLEQTVLTPLGLTNTGVDHQALILPRRAAGYVKENGIVRNAPPIDPSEAYAAGALYSTVGDLLRWDEALYTDRLVPRAALDDMFTPRFGMIGYGWAIGSLFNRRMIHHNGEISGFVSNIARFPDQHVLIVVLSNRDGTQVDDITRDLAAITFGESYEMPHERMIVHLDSAALDRYVGTYRITSDIRLIIQRDRDRLSGRLTGSDAPTFVLVPESDTHFFSDAPPVDLVFTLGAGGRATAVTVNGSFHGLRNR